MRLDPTIISREIDTILALCPELAEDEQLRHDMIDGETEAFTLLSILVRRIGTTKALVASLAAYAKELGERSDRLSARVDAYRSITTKLMGHAKLRKAELPEATLTISPGRRKVLITDESQIPDPMMRQRAPEPDKEALQEVLKAGVVMGGVELSNAEDVLTIRTK